jgi:hypothetical protein
MAKRKPSNTRNVAIPTVESKTTVLKSPDAITERDIAVRAFSMYQARGAQHGHDIEDWLTAERELRGSSSIAVL